MSAARTGSFVVWSTLLATAVVLLPANASGIGRGADVPWRSSPVRAVPGEVVVTFEPGTTPIQAAALHRLSYIHRKEHVRSVEDAKRPETRARRIEGVVAKLGG